MTLAYVGLGANLGDPRARIEQALQDMKHLRNTKLGARSSLYRSAPQGCAGQPDFLNAVARLDTGLPAGELLESLLAIERRHGRERRFRNAPRTLDLDLLLYGDETIDEPGLRVPHPRMHERAFVLAPLLELDPAISIPGRGRACALLAACASQPVARE
jgi:2-amino-4-hydroxy-6-hydroxymethyldihydropteridine diphosphokinase